MLPVPWPVLPAETELLPGERCPECAVRRRLPGEGKEALRKETKYERPGCLLFSGREYRICG